MPSRMPAMAIMATFHSAWWRWRTPMVMVMARADIVVATTAVCGSTVRARSGVATRAYPNPVTAAP